MLEREQLDFVDIATRLEWHVPVLRMTAASRPPHMPEANRTRLGCAVSPGFLLPSEESQQVR
jgi:hypothetical protein